MQSLRAGVATVPGGSLRTAGEHASTQGAEYASEVRDYQRRERELKEEEGEQQPSVERVGEHQINETTMPEDSTARKDSGIFFDAHDNIISAQVHQTKQREQRYLNLIRKQIFRNQKRVIQRFYHRAQLPPIRAGSKDDPTSYCSAFPEDIRKNTADASRQSTIRDGTWRQGSAGDRKPQPSATRSCGSAPEDQLVVYGGVNFSVKDTSKIMEYRDSRRSKAKRRSSMSEEKEVEAKPEISNNQGTWSEHGTHDLGEQQARGEPADLKYQKVRTETSS